MWQIGQIGLSSIIYLSSSMESREKYWLSPELETLRESGRKSGREIELEEFDPDLLLGTRSIELEREPVIVDLVPYVLIAASRLSLRCRISSCSSSSSSSFSLLIVTSIAFS